MEACNSAGWWGSRRSAGRAYGRLLRWHCQSLRRNLQWAGSRRNPTPRTLRGLTNQLPRRWRIICGVLLLVGHFEPPEATRGCSLLRGSSGGRPSSRNCTPRPRCDADVERPAVVGLWRFCGEGAGPQLCEVARLTAEEEAGEFLGDGSGDNLNGPGRARPRGSVATCSSSVLDESSKDIDSLLLLAPAAGKASASGKSEEAIATNEVQHLRLITYVFVSVEYLRITDWWLARW